MFEEKPGISPGLRRNLVLFIAIITVVALWSLGAPGVPDPDKVPAQQIRDSRGASKWAYYNAGVTP